MSCIHFKFRSGADFEPVFFEGHVISVKDLKDAIIQKKKMGKGTDFKLELTNSSTNYEYIDENEMIPRNSSIIVYRVPIHYSKPIQEDSAPSLTMNQLYKVGNLASADASEEDKIRAVMRQSEIVNQESSITPAPARVSKVPICFHCKQIGHVIRSCPSIIRNSIVKEPVHIYLKSQLGLSANSKKATEAINNTTGACADESIPEFLICCLCVKLLSNAVLLPCCGNSFCDTCIQNYLVDHSFSCPSCSKIVKLDDLIPNLSLRKSVTTYQIGRYPVFPHQQDSPQENEAAIEGSVELSKLKPEDNVNESQTAATQCAESMTCVNNMSNIASSLLSKLPFQNMALATTSLLMNPFFESLNNIKNNFNNSYPTWPSIDKMIKVSIPYLTIPYAKSVISGERVLTKEEFKSFKINIANEMKNLEGKSRGSQSPNRRRSRHRSRSSSRNYHRHRRSRSRSRLQGDSPRSSKKENAERVPPKESKSASGAKRSHSTSSSPRLSATHDPITLEINDSLQSDESSSNTKKLSDSNRHKNLSDKASESSTYRNDRQKNVKTTERRRSRSKSPNVRRARKNGSSKSPQRRSVRERDSYKSKHYR